MGQKTNPIGLRVAVNKDWRSKWFADKKEFGKLLTEDREIRALLKKKLETASVPRILIERATNRCRVTILTARPGVVIGRKGSEIDKLKEELSRKTGKEVYVDIVEVKTPELDAQLVAENIAQTAQYAESGNAQVGFLSLTSALTPRLSQEGKYVVVPQEDYGDLFGEYTSWVLGCNSRSRAERLRQLGWEAREKGLFESLVEDEVPVILEK